MNEKLLDRLGKLTGDVVLIQRNPRSGSGRRRQQVFALQQALTEHGMTADIFEDRESLDHAAREFSEKGRLRCLVAAGGDGTLADLLNRHPACPLIPFPAGTENLVARYLGIRAVPEAAAQSITDGRLMLFDTALAGEQEFLIMASCGIDAEVVRVLDEGRTGNISHLSYIGPILRTWFRYPLPRLTITNLETNQVVSGTHVIVQNLPVYGFGLKFCPEAVPFDERLDVRIFSGTSRRALLREALSLKFGRGGDRKKQFRFKTTAVRIECESDSSAGSRIEQCQVDGDPGSPLPLEIRVRAARLPLVVPAAFGQ